MRLRACVYLCTSDEFCAEEKQCASRSRVTSKTEQSESCETENRVYRELRELRTQCTSLFNINKPILFIQFQINKQPSLNKIPINWNT